MKLSGDPQVIDITDELWSGEWGPWNAPDRPTPKGPQFVLAVWDFELGGFCPDGELGWAALVFPFPILNITLPR